MTSLQTRIKQTPFEGGNFYTLASVQLKTYNVDTTGAAGTFSNNGSNIASGQFLRDMGRTVVSSGITFRKVQLVSTIGGPAASNVTNGVVGAADGTIATGVPGFITGYIRLPNNGNNASDSVVRV